MSEKIVVDVITQLPIDSRYTSWWQTMFLRSKDFRCQNQQSRPLDTSKHWNWFTNLDQSIIWDVSQVIGLLIAEKVPPTHVLIADIDFPGLAAAAIPLLRLKYPDLHISGILHAGSYCKGDIFENVKGKRAYEMLALTQMEHVFVATEYHKQLILDDFGTVFDDKTKVLDGLPFFEIDCVKHRKRSEVKKGVIVLGRKDQCAAMEEWIDRFDIIEEPLPRDEYLAKVSRYKYAVLPKTEETFGYQAIECAALHVIPIVPDAYSYKETMPAELRFSSYDDIGGMLKPERYEELLKVVKGISFSDYEGILDRIYTICLRGMRDIGPSLQTIKYGS